MAGIQTSAVINVGTATLGALIGAGGLGQPILTGIRLDDLNLILEGRSPPRSSPSWSRRCSRGWGGW